MNKKIILIIIIIAAVLSFAVYHFYFRDEQPEFNLAGVAKGTVIKEVSETGTVKISEERNLNFRDSGKIEKIYVKVGDVVKAEQKLAQLDDDQLFIQLEEAQAALEVAQANYNKLLAGASEEKIKVAETEVLEAQVSLENSKQNLKDIKDDAEEDLDNAYQDALSTLDDCYLKIYDALNIASKIQRTYFTSNDQEGINVKESKDQIQRSLGQVESYIEEAKTNCQNEKIDTALSEVEDALEDTTNALKVIRDMIETSLYRDDVSSSDKTSLDEQKSYIITAHTNIVNSQQTVSTTKITNKTNINTAQAQVSDTEADLQKAKDELSLLKAEPISEDIDLYQAKIRQAQAEVSLLQEKIQESILRSPDKGQITKVNKKEGEIVQPTESLISFLPAGPFQIKVDIYEEDIIDVRVSNSVDIILVAFPDQVLKGRVTSINPAEKLIEGVVYYEINIDFDEIKEGIKPGMTADIVIETDKKGNVLVIPEDALEKINGKKIVKIFKEGEIEEREIEIGLEGDNDLIEVISGLNEGEDVVVE